MCSCKVATAQLQGCNCSTANGSFSWEPGPVARLAGPWVRQCMHVPLLDRFSQMLQLACTCTNDISAIFDDVTPSSYTQLCHETIIYVDFDQITHCPLPFLLQPSGVYSRGDLHALKLCSILLDHIYQVNRSHLLSFPYSISFRPPLP